MTYTKQRFAGFKDYLTAEACDFPEGGLNLMTVQILERKT